ncbi:MAG: hypothetical protein K2G27_06810, partial [Duncaniella sp.]|nr:hypothetical protein [Duncaniella sp.]
FVPMIAAGVILLLTLIILMMAWRKVSRSLWSRPLTLTFIWFMSYHPVYTLYYYIKGWRKRGSNLTWG